MKVSYQRAYVIGPFLQEKIGFETEADDNASPIAILQMLKDLCDEAHRRLNPSLSEVAEAQYQSLSPERIPEVQVEKPTPTTIEAIVADINSCEWIDKKNSYGAQIGLLGYSHLLATPRIKEAYDKRLKELQ